MQKGKTLRALIGKRANHIRRPAFEPSTPSISVDPAPARALHTDLVSRFKSLNGQPDVAQTSINAANSGGLDLMADEDGKTVEDLLAELGPGDSWKDIKDEEGQIKDLLRTAHKDLESSKAMTTSHDDESLGVSAQDGSARGDHVSGNQSVAEEHQSRMSGPSEEEIDREADEYVAQVLEELRLRPEIAPTKSSEEESGISQPEYQASTSATHSETFNMPSAPDKDIEPPPSYTETTADDDLAARFASLGLPSVPKTIKPSTSNTTAQMTKQSRKGFTDEDIDSWCVICNEDATLRCIGCDNDLYCTRCWLDGHKGPDAGYEERKHKAVQYNKGGGLKKQPARKRMVGA